MRLRGQWIAAAVLFFSLESACLAAQTLMPESPAGTVKSTKKKGWQPASRSNGATDSATSVAAGNPQAPSHSATDGPALVSPNAPSREVVSDQNVRPASESAEGSGTSAEPQRLKPISIAPGAVVSEGPMIMPSTKSAGVHECTDCNARPHCSHCDTCEAVECDDCCPDCGKKHFRFNLLSRLKQKLAAMHEHCEVCEAAEPKHHVSLLSRLHSHGSKHEAHCTECAAAEPKHHVGLLSRLRSHGSKHDPETHCAECEVAAMPERQPSKLAFWKRERPEPIIEEKPVEAAAPRWSLKNPFAPRAKSPSIEPFEPEPKESRSIFPRIAERTREPVPPRVRAASTSVNAPKLPDDFKFKPWEPRTAPRVASASRQYSPPVERPAPVRQYTPPPLAERPVRQYSPPIVATEYRSRPQPVVDDSYVRIIRPEARTVAAATAPRRVEPRPAPPRRVEPAPRPAPVVARQPAPARAPRPAPVVQCATQVVQCATPVQAAPRSVATPQATCTVPAPQPTCAVPQPCYVPEPCYEAPWWYPALGW